MDILYHRIKRKLGQGGWNIKQGMICKWQEIGAAYVLKTMVEERRVMEELELDYVIIKLKKSSRVKQREDN